VATRPSFAAVLAVAAVAASLVLANVRERDCDPLLVRWGSGSRSLHFGWPLVSYRQKEAATEIVSAELVNQDFTGNEAVIPRADSHCLRRWPSSDQPITRIHPWPLAFNTTAQLTMIIATVVIVSRSKTRWFQVSLLTLLLWTTLLAILLASQRDVRPSQEAFWTGRPNHSFDVFDVLQSCGLAVGLSSVVQLVLSLGRKKYRPQPS
jgi:hypothetical protein